MTLKYDASISTQRYEIYVLYLEKTYPISLKLTKSRRFDDEASLAIEENLEFKLRYNFGKYEDDKNEKLRVYFSEDQTTITGTLDRFILYNLKERCKDNNEFGFINASIINRVLDYVEMSKKIDETNSGLTRKIRRRTDPLVGFG